jgi:hypothetical protein
MSGTIECWECGQGSGLMQPTGACDIHGKALRDRITELEAMAEERAQDVRLWRGRHAKAEAEVERLRAERADARVQALHHAEQVYQARLTRLHRIEEAARVLNYFYGSMTQAERETVIVHQAEGAVEMDLTFEYLTQDLRTALTEGEEDPDGDEDIRRAWYEARRQAQSTHRGGEMSHIHNICGCGCNGNHGYISVGECETCKQREAELERLREVLSHKAVNSVVVPEKEYATLWLVAKTAEGILARYPFDSSEQMRNRWDALAQWLAALPDKPGDRA